MKYNFELSASRLIFE